MKADFSGYASKAGLKCSDGRTILAHAFKSNDGQRVPLLWNHMHDDPENVLGHAILEDRADGTYVYGFFNNSPKAQSAKEALAHGDYDSLSVYANKLIQKGSEVLHGMIKEVSLVLAGANPGAKIENVAIAHGDDIRELDDEAVITTGISLAHADSDDSDDSTDSTEQDKDSSDSEDDLTVEDFYETLNEDQKKIVDFIAGRAYEDGAAAADEVENDDDKDDSEKNSEDVQHSENETDSDKKDSDMSTITHSVFDQKANDTLSSGDTGNVLSHSDRMDLVTKVLNTAKQPGNTLKSAVLVHGAEYGITNIDYLFPDSKLIDNQPELLSRQMEWVQEIIGGVKTTPFARVKTLIADITAEEARAKGYVKGKLKKEEVIKLLKRTTDPTTIYKKQKLDRDDILDITDIDVVAWLKREMRLMLNEEIARAILLGDGRAYDSDDKVDEDKIRPIANDHSMYAHPISVASTATAAELEEAIIRGQNAYRGSGSPVMFTTRETLTDLLLQKDTLGRKIYGSITELTTALLVRKIVPVEPMEEYEGLLAVIVNLVDYNVGTNKGGQITDFEDFDIDYNQHKYLSETRISGALVKPKSALVVRRVGTQSVTPAQPQFDPDTNTITIPTTTGVIYSIEGSNVTGEVVIDRDTEVEARPAPGYVFPSGATTDWTFTYAPGE